MQTASGSGKLNAEEGGSVRPQSSRETERSTAAWHGKSANVETGREGGNEVADSGKTRGPAQTTTPTVKDLASLLDLNALPAEEEVENMTALGLDLGLSLNPADLPAVPFQPPCMSAEPPCTTSRNVVHPVEDNYPPAFTDHPIPTTQTVHPSLPTMTSASPQNHYPPAVGSFHCHHQPTTQAALPTNALPIHNQLSTLPPIGHLISSTQAAPSTNAHQSAFSHAQPSSYHPSSWHYKPPPPPPSHR